MEAVRVERVDHLGRIASAINDLGLVSMIDARLQPDEQEAISPDEAVAGIILRGLGFANHPWSLTPSSLQVSLSTCFSVREYAVILTHSSFTKI
jgi:hypothetical protein